jgi:uncharacterized protein
LNRALLDINVLIALLDLDHSHHREARRWLELEAVHGWASCPITQNGCVRIMSQQAYPNPLPAPAIIARLRSATRTPAHQFWQDNIELLDESRIHSDRVHGPKQVTDIYLLALATEYGGRFVTFDRRVPISAVPSARKQHLCVI